MPSEKVARWPRPVPFLVTEGTARWYEREYGRKVRALRPLELAATASGQRLEMGDDGALREVIA